MLDSSVRSESFCSSSWSNTLNLSGSENVSLLWLPVAVASAPPSLDGVADVAGEDVEEVSLRVEGAEDLPVRCLARH